MSGKHLAVPTLLKQQSSCTAHSSATITLLAVCAGLHALEDAVGGHCAGGVAQECKEGLRTQTNGDEAGSNRTDCDCVAQAPMQYSDVRDD